MGAFRYWLGPARRRAWDDLGRLMGGLPVFRLWLILFLLSLLPWAWSLSLDKPLIALNRQTLAVLAVPVLLFALFLAQLFAAPARIHADQVRRIADTESRLTPKLALEFEPNDGSCVSAQGAYHWTRIGVRNTGTEPIAGVSVSLVTLDPNPGLILPCALNATHGLVTNPGDGTFTLSHSSDHTHVELLQSTSRVWVVWFFKYGDDPSVAPGDYRAVLAARGHGVVETRRAFLIAPDGNRLPVISSTD